MASRRSKRKNSKTHRRSNRKTSHRSRYRSRGGRVASKAHELIAQAEALKKGMHGGGGGLRGRYQEAIRKLKGYLHKLRIKLSGRKGMRSRKETERLVEDYNTILKYLEKEGIEKTGFYVHQFAVPSPSGSHNMTSFLERNDPGKHGQRRRVFSVVRGGPVEAYP